MSACRLLLIVAPPGPFRDSLRVLLQAEPRIGRVLLADTLAEGGRCIAQQPPPDSLIIDTDLPDPAVWSFCALLKTRAPSPRCAVIIHNQDQQAIAQALALPTLLAGFESESLFETIFNE